MKLIISRRITIKVRRRVKAKHRTLIQKKKIKKKNSIKRMKINKIQIKKKLLNQRI